MSQPHSSSHRSQHPHHLPIIPLDQSGLRSLDSVISGYLPCLASRWPVPRSTIAVLGEIRRKLAPLLQPGGFPEGTALPLTRDELRALTTALRGFITLLSRHIAPSEQRESTIAELRRLQRYCERLV